MTTLNNYIINLLKNKLNRKNVDSKNLVLLNKGKFANAFLFRYNDDEVDLTIKDFYHCPWFIRVTFGRIAPWIEYRSLKKLQGIPGIAGNSCLLGKYTMAFSYIKGDSLKSIEKNKQRLQKEVFIELEKSVRSMHKRNMVHLDLRNLGNVLKGEDDILYMIDFQSSLGTSYLPKKLRKILEDSDISGVYKCWKSVCQEPLDAEREKFLNDFNSLRKIWVFKGYPIHRLMKKIKEKKNK